MSMKKKRKEENVNKKKNFFFYLPKTSPGVKFIRKL